MTLNLKKNLENDVQSLVLLLDDSVSIPSSLPEVYEAELQQMVEPIFSREVFTGKIGQVHSGMIKVNDGYVDVMLVGMGNYDSFSPIKLQHAVAESIKKLKSCGVETVDIYAAGLVQFMDSMRKRSILMAEAVHLSGYEFNRYKSDSKEDALKAVTLIGDFDETALDEGSVLAASMMKARELVNLPANELTPEALGARAVSLGEESGFEVELKDLTQIKELGMEAYLSVTRASALPPVLIVMRYTGAPDSDQRLGLVGKGLTYDSGGLSIKPTASMVNMKDDMGGAATVIGAMNAIASMKLKVNVTAVVAACENMISGTSYRPGDIISSMAGKSIFIGNTDAEGRLTLIDAVNYIIDKENASAVIDVATLTGAAVHCLGTEATCAISNNDDYYELVAKGFSKANENVWRFPIFDEYKELLKHHEADLTNIAGSPGMITAGMFIGEFVKDKPWVHLDIAGTAFRDKAKGIYTRGGTGVAVRPLYYVAKKLAHK